MEGYDSAEGYRVEPLDNRDSDDPNFTIDPMLSGTQDDGGKHRELRHREAEPTPKTPAEKATFDPRENA